MMSKRAVIIAVVFCVIVGLSGVHFFKQYQKRKDAEAFVHFLETDAKGYNVEGPPEYNFDRFRNWILDYEDDGPGELEGRAIYALEEFIRQNEYGASPDVIDLVGRSDDEDVLYVALRYLARAKDKNAIRAISELLENSSILIQSEAKAVLADL